MVDSFDVKLDRFKKAIGVFNVFTNEHSIAPDQLCHGVVRWSDKLTDLNYLQHYRELELSLQVIVYKANSYINETYRNELMKQTQIKPICTPITFNNGLTKIDDGVRFLFNGGWFYIPPPKIHI